MAYNPKDFYFKKAKKDNFLARSVYKLEEIDAKFKLLRPGQTVIDLGASPGSWSQFVSKKIGDNGFLIAVDLQEIKMSAKNTVCICHDALDVDYTKLLLENSRSNKVDLVVSDMAPKTTGIRSADQAKSTALVEFAFQLSTQVLKPGGNLVAKLFHSDDFKELKILFLSRFSQFHAIRPQSSRKESKEIFILGLGFKG